MSDCTLYIFLHVPKCAGSTVGHHLAHQYAQTAALPIYVGCPYWNVREGGERHFESREDIDRYLELLTDEQKNELRILYGHDVYYGVHRFFPGRSVRYVTVLRAPEERVVSSYWYRRAFALRAPYEPNWGRSAYYRQFWTRMREEAFSPEGPRTFQEWLPYYDGFLTDFLVERGFGKKLKEFYFVGILGRSLDLSLLYRLLGVRNRFPDQNVSKKETAIPLEEARAYLQEVRPEDLRIFARGVARNRLFKVQHPFLFIELPLGWSPRNAAYHLSTQLRKRSQMYGALVDRVKSYL